MEDTTPVTDQKMINNLVLDKKIQDYRSSKELQFFWDILGDCITEARIEQELTVNAGKYYGNKKWARNALIMSDLTEAHLLTSTRDAYAKVTCEKILQFFRGSVFSWSTGGKNYVEHGGVEVFKRMPARFLDELYDHNNIAELEAVSELIDDIVVKIAEEFRSFEAVRACHDFYTHKTKEGRKPLIYRDCLEHMYDVVDHIRGAAGLEMYFQNAGARIRQYRDMLDPDKNLTEEYRLFLSSSNKPLTLVTKEVEETLVQYVMTLVSFEQFQKKQKKDELKLDINGFLQKTWYTLDTLHLEIEPTYKTTMDKVMFKHSGWEIKPVPVKIKK